MDKQRKNKMTKDTIERIRKFTEDRDKRYNSRGVQRTACGV